MGGGGGASTSSRYPGKSHINVDSLSRVPRPCQVSECLRNEKWEEDTTANVRVVRDTDIEWKSLRDQHLTDTSRTGPAAKLGGCVRDERRHEDILGPVGHPPDARGSSLSALGIT